MARCYCDNYPVPFPGRSSRFREEVMCASRIALAAFALALGANAAAQTVITVNTTSTSGAVNGDCEFDEAVLAAQTATAVDACPAGSVAQPNKIVFAPALAGSTISYSTAPMLGSGEIIIDAQQRPIVLQATGTADALQIVGANVTLRDIELRGSASGNGITLVSGNLSASNSTIQGRLGINAFGSGSMVTLDSSTVASTETNPVSDIAVRAGVSTSLTINNSTIVASVGSGIDDSSSTGTATVYSSIIVGATPVNGASTNSGGTLLATSTANAGLDSTLASNGGPTRTYALTTGSAIDGGDCSAAPLPKYDQRYYFNPDGGGRAVGAACDAGAYESGAQDLLADRVFADGFEF